MALAFSATNHATSGPLRRKIEKGT